MRTSFAALLEQRNAMRGGKEPAPASAATTLLIADAMSRGRLLVLEGQGHIVPADVLAPVQLGVRPFSGTAKPDMRGTGGLPYKGGLLLPLYGTR